MNKCERLKTLINSDSLSFLMECHSGISARIVEEAGFSGGWISGLSLSAAAGVRDRNELSFKEVADLCYYICSRVNIPMLLDMDTGYGDYNTASTAIKMIEKAGVAGVCVEDKLFPKHNSFLDNSGSDLEDPYVFAAKIKALRNSVENPDFVIIARLEEFISGKGLDEAVRRALIYQDAGADAILVHSKIRTCDEIDSFMEVWNGRKLQGLKAIPIVIVPTKYYQTPTDHFRDIGISTVIWANHNMRASISSMQLTSRKIKETESLESVENEIVPVSEIFRLQRDQDVAEKEKEYLPAYGGSAIILSGKGNPYYGVPKSFVEINGTTILNLLEEGLKSEGISESFVVLGEYLDSSCRIQYSDLKYPMTTRFIVNNEWSDTTEVGSTLTALDEFSDNIKLPLFVVYGDLVFKDQAFSKMTRAGVNSDIVLGVDPYYDPEMYNEFVKGDKKYNPFSVSDQFEVIGADTNLPDNDFAGSFVGIVKIVTYSGLRSFIKAVSATHYSNSKDRFFKVIQKLINSCRVSGVYITDSEWTDINGLSDEFKAMEVVKNGRKRICR